MRLGLYTWTAFVLLGLGTLPAIAQTAAPTPASSTIAPPTCEKPDPKPLENRPGNDSGAIMAYNAKVHRYNRLSKAFNTCSRAYVESVNRAIAQVQGTAQQQTRQIVDNANRRIRAIEAQVDAAVTVGNGGTAPALANPDPDFPPATCIRPAQTASDYANRRRAFETCTRDYIARGKTAMDQAKTDADKSQQQVIADANRRVQLLNTLAQQVTDGANQEARATAAMLDSTPGL